MRIYRRLLAARGHAGWWPGADALEVCVGAVLVQNTAWANAEKALAVLRQRGLLTFAKLRALPAEALAPLIRSSGCFNVKARRLRALLAFLDAFGGRPEAMAGEDLGDVRRRLLAVPGIGPETADSILLYAAGRPVFVVDAYTRRVFGRLGLLRGGESYDAVQAAFMRNLPPRADLFNDFHAQIVLLAKDFCRPRPLCPACPLGDLCPRRGVARDARMKRSSLGGATVSTGT
ncbi:MAG TPA: endonuclease [Vicinamibacteria bacterium]|nr:endonuclease [Vicinamibacteria bacterium]